MAGSKARKHIALGLLMGCLNADTMAVDIDALWDYDQPGVSETRFREALKSESGDDALELETQIARAESAS